MIHKLLYIAAYLWNSVLLRLLSAKYTEPPKIIGFLKGKGLKGKLFLGKGVYINSNKWANPVGLSSSTYFCINPGAVISIGNHVMISNSLLFAFNKIQIEDHVMIGGGCQILDSDFHSMDYNLRTSLEDQLNVVSRPVIIREGAFIGTQSIVLKGVEIGARSIVAAGSVVSKSIPAGQIWGGNPAVFIKNIQ